ncbi:MAG: S16 family serine protease [Desulfamplus sp.]
MALVINIISNHNRFLTQKTVQTIYWFRKGYANNDTLIQSFDRAIENILGILPVNLNEFEQAIESYKQPFLPEGVETICGQSCFPAVNSTDGAVYMLKILDTCDFGAVVSPSRSLNQSENHLLDITVSAFFSYLNQNSKNSSEQQRHKLSIPISFPLIGNPSRYTFLIEDSFGKEVNNKVEGSSMGVAMFISLASLIYGQPVPIEIASSATINRHGEVLPVQSIYKKLKAIKTERDYITKIIISDRQVLPDDSPEFEYIRVRKISEVIQAFFPTSSISVPLTVSGSHILIDLQQAIDTMERQYRDYMIDTCMENCCLLINYIERAINHDSEKPGAKSEQIKAESQKINAGFMKIKGTDIRLEYLFRCYWKSGACYCHKGNITESEKYLKKADRIYKENRSVKENMSIIEHKDYYNSQNNYAVLLKDIFCYKKAEKLHRKIEQELRANRLPPKHISENSSSLSQLYLAQHKYEQAETLQKQALEWIATDEKHRNYGYLAQIYARMGAFDKAEESLEHASKLIDRIQDISIKTNQLDFYHWIESEYLYRKIVSLKRKPGKYHDRFSSLYKKYENITHFSHGLINKFCGLGMILFKKPEAGLQLLNRAEDYFDAQIHPMMALLGVTVRIEKISVWCDMKCSFNQEIMDEIDKVIIALSVQKNIKKFFHKDITILEKLLSWKREPVNNRCPDSGGIAATWGSVLKIVQSINHKIPY